MKYCPNCGEILGTHADSCFRCHFDYRIGRVPESANSVNPVMSEEERQKIAEDIHKLETERAKVSYIQRRQNLANMSVKDKLEFIQQLPIYEYATEVISDARGGGANVAAMNAILKRYAQDGWKLHTAMTNEIGKNSETNTTVEQTILIFERMISKGNI